MTLDVLVAGPTVMRADGTCPYSGDADGVCWHVAAVPMMLAGM